MKSRLGLFAALAALLGRTPDETAPLPPDLMRMAGGGRVKRRMGTAARHRRAVRRRQRERGWRGPLLMVPCPGAPKHFKPGDCRDPNRTPRKPWKRRRTTEE